MKLCLLGTPITYVVRNKLSEEQSPVLKIALKALVVLGSLHNDQDCEILFSA